MERPESVRVDNHIGRRDTDATQIDGVHPIASTEPTMSRHYLAGRIDPYRKAYGYEEKSSPGG